MTIAALAGFLPAFGLAPDIAEGVAPRNDDLAWLESRLRPGDLARPNDAAFITTIWLRLQGLLQRPVREKRDAVGRTMFELLGCWLLVRQRNGCVRAYGWHCKALGQVKLVPIPDSHVVAQDMPYRFHWLNELVRPVALEYLCWHGSDATEPALANIDPYIRWMLLSLFGPRLAQQGRLKTLRVQVADKVCLDPWALSLANRMLRERNKPQRALLADYNTAQRHKSAFVRLERDAPNLVSLFGVLCRSRGFPRKGEPVQRLREYLLGHGISPRAWRVVSRSGPRLWLMLNHFYRGDLADSALDLIRCIDALGFDRPPPHWLLELLLVPHGGPNALYPTYADRLENQQTVWRHLVRLLQGCAHPSEALEMEVDRVVRWADAVDMLSVTTTQRRAGWSWLTRNAQDWETREQLRQQSKFGRWPVPMTEIDWVDHRFRFLDSPLALWIEAREMLHCADQYASRCAKRQCWLVSIRRDGKRVGTLELDREGEWWIVRQLAAKANRPCVTSTWKAANSLVALLNGDASKGQVTRKSAGR